MLDFLSLQTMTENSSVITLIYAMLLAFILSTLIAITYEKTYRALSYSRNYVQTLILISIVAAAIMQAVGDSLARGLGIMAAMAVIRFRTNFKDPRDIVFIFASLSVGVSCGVFGFHIAIVGTFAFILAAFLLYFSPFGQSSFYDGMLRFNLDNSPENKEKLEAIFKEYTKNFALITLRDVAQGNRLEYAYQVKLKRDKKHYHMVEELQTINSIKGITFMLQEATVEL
ncbi:MAG: DUF4956 domain-containing protein [Campylobacterota bacterium]|nr:DUF4956 domain-containing protein [Campylobacterota bacterium]